MNIAEPLCDEYSRTALGWMGQGGFGTEADEQLWVDTARQF